MSVRISIRKSRPSATGRSKVITRSSQSMLRISRYVRTGRVVSKALMIAYGTNDDGRREILGFSAYRNESRETWKDFLTGLKKRAACTGLMMITSDPHDGIINAAREVFPDTFHGSGVSFTFQRAHR